MAVVDISDHRPHLVSEVMCVKCLRRWIGIYPESVWLKELECENCGPGFVISTGQLLDNQDD